jgi:drug/metabolite transporter (DMT)-like permease
VFGLYVFVLERWSASLVSYEFLLIPVVTAIYSALLTGEALTLPVLLGGLIILGGVYVGLYPPHRPPAGDKP